MYKEDDNIKRLTNDKQHNTSTHFQLQFVAVNNIPVKSSIDWIFFGLKWKSDHVLGHISTDLQRKLQVSKAAEILGSQLFDLKLMFLHQNGQYTNVAAKMMMIKKDMAWTWGDKISRGLTWQKWDSV